ncbi:hypothetical protein [Neptunicella marina]|uniref:Uncharacterized protein n=1 Tax=Neptunicella marina TaxID=2125989 RepID=A0A8J6IUE6_9ALTE|nr:hypothetical protein [Neptunicella marina]MBC3767560.1 hypothetical protein [Neptunicella marina]
MRVLQRLLKSVFLLCGILIILCGVLIFLAIEKTPLVVAQSHVQVENADTLPALLKRLQRLSDKAHRHQNISLNAKQLNSLAGFAQRAQPAVRAQVNLGDTRSVAAMSYQLPAPLDAYFINIQAWLQEGEGFPLESVQIGDLYLPGKMALGTLTYIADSYIGKPVTSELISRIERTAMDPQRLQLSLAPVQDVIISLKSIKRELSEDEQYLQQRVSFYLDFLQQFKPLDLQLPAVSLNQYLVALFTQASQQSNPDNAATENKAALLALAIFDGSKHFARLSGNFDREQLEKARPKHLLMLASRRDLCQHFVYSAAIEILSQQGISAAVGELKELMDRNNSGSGFSFADLSADLAGIKLAMQATHSDKARRLQQRFMQHIDESFYFPDIKNLPEGLHKDQFNQAIGDVDGERYIALKQQVQQRVDNLPLYQD